MMPVTDESAKYWRISYPTKMHCHRRTGINGKRLVDVNWKPSIYEKVQKLHDHKIVGCKWVFTYKLARLKNTKYILLPKNSHKLKELTIMRLLHW